MKKIKPTAIEIVTVKGASVGIYETPTTKNGKEYPGHTLVWTASGKRERKFVTDFDKAKATAKFVAGQLSGGSGHVHALSPAAVADYTAAIGQLRQHPGASLAGVVAEWVQAKSAAGEGSIVTSCQEFRKTIDRQSGFTPVLLHDVVEQFYKHLDSADASRRYRQDCRSRMGRAATVFRCHIHGITSQDLGAWLDGMKVAPRTRRNSRNAMVTLFSFAKEQGYLPRDRQTEAELIPSRRKMNATKRSAPIGIYSPGDLAKILESAPAELLPVFAIAAFAGIRSAEIHRLRWDDVKADHIVVSQENAKTASRRIVPILPALKSWLAKCKVGEGDERLARSFSYECSFARGMTRAIRAAGVTPVHNGFRHSYCTYRLADIQNAAQTAMEAGNSPTMLFRHYRELATQQAAKDWFNVGNR